MTLLHADPSPFLEWGVASLPLPGEPTSGDLHVVRGFDGGVLVAAVDGLGHGVEAAAAARRAADTLSRYGHESVIALLRRCHQACFGTRGVVLSVASFNATEDTMSWLGIGNVEGVLLRADQASVPSRETILLRGGVVGYELPPLHASVLSVGPGDTLIFATDGIRPGFIGGLKPNESPQGLADQILGQHAKGTDDGLVLVARYRKE